MQHTTAKRASFHGVIKFCEICGKELILKTNIHIERKRFCSVSCRMKATNKKRFEEPEVTEHACKRCGQTKPVEQFYTVNYRGKSHPRQFCKACCKIETYSAFEKHPEWVMEIRTRRSAKRKSLPFRMESAGELGLSIAEAQDIYNRQGGLCAVCGKPPKPGRRLCLDHNHATGKVRQFLHNYCNTSLAVLENKPLFEKLSAYLARHETTI